MNHPAGRAVPKSVIWWIRIIVAFVVVVVVVVVVVAAVAIGVEVGIRHTRRNHSSTIRYDLLLDPRGYSLTSPVR